MSSGILDDDLVLYFFLRYLNCLFVIYFRAVAHQFDLFVEFISRIRFFVDLDHKRRNAVFEFDGQFFAFPLCADKFHFDLRGQRFALDLFPGSPVYDFTVVFPAFFCGELGSVLDEFPFAVFVFVPLVNQLGIIAVPCAGLAGNSQLAACDPYGFRLLCDAQAFLCFIRCVLLFCRYR